MTGRVVGGAVQDQTRCGELSPWAREWIESRRGGGRRACKRGDGVFAVSPPEARRASSWVELGQHPHAYMNAARRRL